MSVSFIDNKIAWLYSFIRRNSLGTSKKQWPIFVSVISVSLFHSHAFAQSTYFPATGLYNGYLEQINIVECDNAGSGRVNPTLSLFSIDGKELKSIALDISPQGSQHIILNDLINIKDTYGTYKLKLPAGQMLLGDRLSCRTVFYRTSSPGTDKAYDFAYALPVRNPDTGINAGSYNSYNPVGISDQFGSTSPTYNWLSVVNLDAVPFTAEVALYDISGTFIKSIPIQDIASNARIDIALGHDIGQVVGTYRVIPKDKSLKYQAFLMRYGVSNNNLQFAFPLQATSGACTGKLIQLSTMGSAQTANWLEVVNLNTTEIPVRIVVRDREGKLLKSLTETLSPFAQYHLYANSIIDADSKGNVGTAQIVCSDPTDRVLTQSLYYGKSSPEKVEWAYASQDTGISGVATTGQLFLPINTYLDMKNWVKLSNNSGLVSATYNVFDQAGNEVASGEQTLSPLGTADLGIHAQVAKDTIGSTITSSKTPGSVFSGELLRITNKNSGEIANIIQIPGVVQRRGSASQKVTDGIFPSGFIGDPQSLSQYRDNLTYEEVSHLYGRAALGASHLEILRLQEQGLKKSINELMTFKETPGLESSAKSLLNFGFPDEPNTISVGGTKRYWIHHILNTPNPLKERLALVWHDLFAASCSIIDIRVANTCLNHLNLIRNNSLGNFKTIARGMSTDFLMLRWLNGNQNVVGKPDENYGREFWELFTLGESSKHRGRYKLYDSKDIAEASRAFTGWTANTPVVQDPLTRSVFVSSRFDAGTKTIFAGTPYETTGNLNYLDVVDKTLARHEAAEWVAKRLFTAFVHDNPNAKVVNELADLLLVNNYNLAPVVRKILQSEAMFSLEAKQKRVKDAITYIVGFIRATDLPVATDTIFGELYDSKLGYEPLSPPSVNGWPINKYQGATLSQHFLGWNTNYVNLIRRVLTNADRVSSGFSYSSLIPFAGANANDIVSHWSLVLGVRLTNDERIKLVDYMNTQRRGDGSTFKQVFDSTNPIHLRQKVPGLLWLLSQHEDYLSF